MSKQAEWGPHRRALVDSAAYFAVVEGRDANHRAARMVAQGLADRHWRFYTTNFVVAEAHALILVRSGRSLAARFLSEIGESRATVVVRAREADERRAREIIDRYDDKDFSLTDAITSATSANGCRPTRKTEAGPARQLVRCYAPALTAVAVAGR